MTDAIDRRVLLGAAAALAAGAPLPTAAQPGPHRHPPLPADAPKVAFLIYPQMVALDLIGPMTVFKVLGCDVQLVWKDKEPLLTDVGAPIAATQSFSECPRDLDVICVPGGIIGTTACMDDAAVLGFLADRGAGARWVTSVCTGSLVLAAAGLLDGYDATSHWAVADLLPIMGARHVDRRVVFDRNRVTGGGVTAGIDFGLALAAQLRGEDAARRAQLMLEYAPDPPFRNGTPADAGERRVAELRAARRGMDEAARDAALRAGERLGTWPRE